MTIYVMVLSLLIGIGLLSMGIYLLIKDSPRKQFNGWLVGDKVKLVGYVRTYILLGWSKNYIYIDKDGETIKYDLAMLDHNMSSEWRKNYNECKIFMGREPGFDSFTGERKKELKLINGRTIDSLNETECLIYLKQCLEDEDFETAELIKQRMEELK